LIAYWLFRPTLSLPRSFFYPEEATLIGCRPLALSTVFLSLHRFLEYEALELHYKLFQPRTEVEVLLAVDLGDDATLEGIRINVAPLMDATIGPDNEAVLTVSITNAQRIARLRTTVSFEQFRVRNRFRNPG
jgi:hypothetical protein